MPLFNGTSGPDSLLGSDQDDTINGFEGNDTLIGGLGNDWLTGGPGVDSIDGGFGLDTVFYEDAPAGIALFLNLGFASNNGEGQVETVINVENAHGSQFNDVIQLSNTGGYIFARAGNDSLTGGDGNDQFYGGSGNDTINGGGGNDTANYLDTGFDAAGADTQGAVINLSAGLATDSWGFTDVLSGIENVIGSGRSDSITGDGGNNSISGDAGNDTLIGLSGNDSLTGGEGQDSLVGGDGNDQLRGDAGNDTLIGGAGNDYLTGGSGDDSLVGGAGTDTADYFYSDSIGPVIVNLTAGSANGGGGNDTLVSIENVNGTDFGDTISGDAGANFIEGRGGNDSLLGMGGDDNLQGGDGNDTVLGGAGNDFLVGGSGDDLLDGGAQLDIYFGTDSNSVSYSSSAASVLIDMSGVSGDGSIGSGFALDGLGGTDTLKNLHIFTGSSYNDTILGSDAAIFESFNGGLGDDILNGGAYETVYLDAFNRVDYGNASGSVTVDLRAGKASGAAGNDTLLNFHSVRASNHADTLFGSDTTLFTEQFEGRAGNDTIDGRGGSDMVRYGYLSSGVGVYVNLGTGIAIAGSGDIDTLINIERVRGSQYNDTLIGGGPDSGADQFDGFESFRGEAGNDFIDGGAGFDDVNYSSSTSGVYVVLGGTGAGYAFDGLGGIDTLWNIEQVYGSFYDDMLIGSDSADFESFDGQIGNDTIDGRGGIDRVSYYGSRAAVTIDLSMGYAIEYYRYGGTTPGTDTLINIEWARGSENFGDTMIGSALANKLEGNGGDDTIDGGAGIDTMEGGNGSDVYVVRDVGDIVTETNRLRAVGGDDLVISYITAAMSVTGFVLGDYVENLRIETTEAANGSGNNLDNIIHANLGNNVLDGGAGIDTISFSHATAAVVASIDSATTGVQATGGSGNDTLRNFENITGGSAGDTLTGSAAANIISGGQGADTMNGGLGNDTYIVDNAGDVVIENSSSALEIDQIVSSVTYSLAALANVENLLLTGSSNIHATGNAKANLLTGNSGNNSLIGAGGNDTLDGGLGVDTLAGGEGDDTYDVDSASDVVTELSGQGNDTVRSTVSYSLVDTDGAGANGDNVENLRLMGSGDINGTGNGLANIIYSGQGNSVIDGLGGIDTVSYAFSQIGVNGSMTGIFKGTGFDTLTNIENIEGSAMNDSLTGDTGSNRLTGLAGNDNFNLQSGGNDTVLGGEGSDYFNAGGAGNMLLDGGVVTDVVNGIDMNAIGYLGASASVIVNLAGITGDGSSGSGTANKGVNGVDTIISINIITGSNFDDRLTGSTSSTWEQFDGGPGNDTIDGGLITDTLNFDNSNRITYANASSGVNVNFTSGVVTGGGGNDTIANFNEVRGSNYDDVLTGSGFASEQFEGGAGDDTIDGGAGVDRARYVSSSAAVFVSLIDGYALDGYGGIDTLINIERVAGSKYADTLIGGNPANGSGALDGFEGFDGRGGDDTIDGGTGYDRVEYGAATQGVLVRLGGTGNGIAYDGLGGVDTLINIEAARGSYFADRLFGSNSGAFESFEGMQGNDTIDGMGGTDRVDYRSSRAAVTVNLLTGTASDGYGDTDTLISIEDVRGSIFGDTIVGNATNNKLTGDAGNDTLTGGGGVDTFVLATGSTDTVTDFATGPGGDLLDLSGVIAQFTNYTGGSNPFASGHLRLTQSGANTLVQADVDGVGSGAFQTIGVLNGVAKTAVTAANIIGSFSPGNSPVVSDFNGDGKSDILWRNSATGDNTIWKAGVGSNLQAVAKEPNQDWQVAGVGDFQGDGKADILWHNYATGQNYVYNSGNAATGAMLVTVSDLNWQVVGIGDFDADGKSDVLWRNSATGANTIWKAGNGANLQGVATEASQAWQVAGVGDFQGDGKADILWRNSSTGQNYVYYSANAATGALLTTVSDMNWKVVGIGDFDADGKSDILWRNSATGDNTIWKAGNGANLQAVARESNLAWQVAGTGDLQGDGKADILWHNNSSGQNYVYYSANAATGALLTTVSDLNWNAIDGLETGDLLNGGNGANRLIGTINADVLFGGLGNDTMTGGAGADLFRYTNTNQGLDSITDFMLSVDKIQVVGSAFGGLPAGALQAGKLVANANPVVNQAGAQFLYNTTTGMLAFDADGTGAAAAVDLVTLIGKPLITQAELMVVTA